MNKFYPVAGMVALSAVTTACQQADKQREEANTTLCIS